MVARAVARPCAPRSRIPSALPPGTSTTKWVAPPRFGTQLLPPEAPPSPGVDETMDDEPRVSTRTVAIPGAPSAPRRSSELDTAPPQRRAARMPVPASKPPSGVETTLAGDEAPAPALTQHSPRPTAPLWRGALIGTVCFLVGALGMVVFVWKAGLVGPGPQTSTERPRETSAPQARLEAPPEFAAPEPPAALPPLDLSVPPRPRVAGPTASAAARPSSPVGAAGAAVPVRQVAVESSNAKPGVGQPVDFAARFPASARPTKVDGALFLIAGPGVAAGTALPASDDGGGVFRTTFTFLEEGRFDVTFTARADGSPAHGTRAIVVGDPGTSALPPPEAPSPPPVNATSNGGTNARWL